MGDSDMPTLENAPAVADVPAVATDVKPGGGKTVKKAAPKKAAKKAEVKAAPKKGAKAAPKKAAAKKEAGTPREVGPSKTQVEVLKLLNKGKEMTRSELSEKLEGAWVGSDMMGHLEEGKAKPNSLTARGLVKAQTFPNKETGAEGPVHYSITAAGKKFLESLKG